MRRFVVLVLAALGCASTSPKAAFDETAKVVAERSGANLAWTEEQEANEQVDKAVADLLSRPLTVDAAVQVGLLRNRHLAARIEELGIAQAELVQAGLLKNPTLFGSIHLPISDDAVADSTLVGAWDLMDAFAVPAKKHIAESRRASVQAQVAQDALDAARDIAFAYYSAVAASQSLAMRRAVLESGQASAELAKRLTAAGNASELDQATHEAELTTLMLDALHAEERAALAREDLTRAMGLYGPEAGYSLPDKLPELPASEGSSDQSEGFAISRRLDLVAAHEEAQSISHELAMAKNFRVLGLVGAVDVTHENTFTRSVVAGPGTSLELPIFDQKQAVIARLEARLRQALAREGALAVDIRSEVRSARSRWKATRARLATTSACRPRVRARRPTHPTALRRHALGGLSIDTRQTKSDWRL